MLCYQTSTTSFVAHKTRHRKQVALIEKINPATSLLQTPNSQQYLWLSLKESRLIAKPKQSSKPCPAVLNNQSQSENCQQSSRKHLWWGWLVIPNADLCSQGRNLLQKGPISVSEGVVLRHKEGVWISHTLYEFAERSVISNLVLLFLPVFSLLSPPTCTSSTGESELVM